MKRLILAIISSGLLLIPSAAYAADYGTASTADKPPVAQTLVREGDYAIRLADTLQLGTAENEANAEDMLAAVGIAPDSGWISDFPVTPAIIAQIRTSVKAAAEAGKIAFSSEDADTVLIALNRDLGLAVVTGTTNNSAPASETDAPQYSEPAVINNYYYDEGPPVVTYYAPPPDYWYLYAWDPFPFRCNGFFFPGFFVLRNFTTVVVVNNGGTVIVRGGHRVIVGSGTTVAFASTKILSNHVIDPVTRSSVRVDPVSVRPTVGTSFNPPGARNFSQVRASSPIGAISGGEHRAPSGFDRTGATNIFTRSVARERTGTAFTTGVQGMTTTRASGRPSGDRANGAPTVRSSSQPTERTRSFDRPAVDRGRVFTAPSGGSRTFSAPPDSGHVRSFSAPSGGGRSFGEARSSSAPSVRSFSAPSGSGRSFDRGGGRSFGGEHSFSGSGRSFGGSGGMKGR